jgi:hypothetical protein
MISYSGNNNDDDIYDDPDTTETTDKAEKKEEEKELTLAGIIEILQNDHQLMEKLLGNLDSYFKSVAAKCNEDPTLALPSDRQTMNICSDRFNHH